LTETHEGILQKSPKKLGGKEKGPPDNQMNKPFPCDKGATQRRGKKKYMGGKKKGTKKRQKKLSESGGKRRPTSKGPHGGPPKKLEKGAERKDRMEKAEWSCKREARETHKGNISLFFDRSTMRFLENTLLGTRHE